MTSPRYVAIFGAMRTGSNLLERSIQTLSDATCFGEAFNPAFIGEPRGYEIEGWDTDRRDADPLGFLSALRKQAGSRMAVFRIFQAHNDSVLSHALSDPDCCRIVLQRDPVDSFVSLQIARETGQWLLKLPRRRMTARIPFDPEKFTMYRERLAAFYRDLDERMAAAGTSALRLDYADLGQPETGRRIAAHIGSRDAFTGPADILRQNPASLAQKVTNYNEMCAFLGREPEEAPPIPAPSAGIGDALVPPNVPLIALPLWGPGHRAAISLLYRYERRFHDGPSLGHGQLIDLVEREGLYRLSKIATLAGRASFAIHCHPVERLHGGFIDDVFGSDWQTSIVRRRLMEQCGDLPSPRELAKGASLSEASHRAAFAAFLDLVAASIAGEGPIAMRPDWLSQSALLDQYASETDVDDVFALDDLIEAESWLAERAGVDGLPEKHVADVARWARATPLPLAPVQTPEILDQVRNLHSADFGRFGYGDCPAAPD